MNTNINLDPYAILQIDHEASIEDIKKAYYAIAKVYHPDKGGNNEMFRILTQAYELIMSRVSQSNNQSRTNSNTSTTREEIDIPMRGNIMDMRGSSFSSDKFNEQFSGNMNLDSDFVYGVNESDYKPRNLADYRRERDSISMDLENMKPLFNKGHGFDKNVFNRIFDKYKRKQDQDHTSLIKYDEPQAMVGMNAISFSNLNPHMGQMSRSDIITGDLSRNYCDLNDNNDNFFQHPSTLTPDDYSRLRNKPDVTEIGKLSTRDMKERMNEYQRSNIVIPKGGSKPPSGDLNYEFDPYYKQRNAPPTQSTIQFQSHQPTNRQQPSQQLLLQQQSQQPLLQIMPSNNNVVTPIQYPQQSNNYQQSNQQRQIISYNTNDVDSGKPMMPKIVYSQSRQQQQSNQNMQHQQQQIDENLRIQRLENELHMMRKKVNIQDKLIRKINRNN